MHLQVRAQEHDARHKHPVSTDFDQHWLTDLHAPQVLNTSVPFKRVTEAALTAFPLLSPGTFQEAVMQSPSETDGATPSHFAVLRPLVAMHPWRVAFRFLINFTRRTTDAKQIPWEAGASFSPGTQMDPAPSATPARSTTRSSCPPWRCGRKRRVACVHISGTVSVSHMPHSKAPICWQGYLTKLAAASAKGRRPAAAAAAALSGEENASGPSTPRAADKLLRLPLLSLTAADMNTRSPSSSKRGLPR